MRVLLVIPAYNEEEALPKTIAHLSHLPEGYEILIVNDGSKDRTKFVAEELSRKDPRVHVVHLPVNCGIGVAVQTGYRYALMDGGYRYVIQFDADGQHPADYIQSLVDACEKENLDLCVGSRFITNFGTAGSRSTFSRRVGIRFFAWLIGLLSGVKVTDPTSGFRCAGPRAWKRFSESYPEDYPEPESLFWCARNRFKVAELPVRMYERQGGVSSIRKLKAAYYMVKVSLAIFFDRLRGAEYRHS